MTLLIMAAGMGSRFGGLKQIEPVGPNNEFIVDYSIYDALQAGFDKVVFIIKKENYALFKDTVGKRIEPFVEVHYVFQEQENIPSFVNIPSSRIKPWGTAHAILSAKDVIKENFAIINADDFYGRDAFFQIAHFLKNNNQHYAMVVYLVKNTLTENGSVKRGICKINHQMLDSIVESSIEQKDNIILASPLDGSTSFEVEQDTFVSMNLFGFTPSIFPFLEEKQELFFKQNLNNLETCEFLIPEEVKNLIKEGKIQVEILPTTSKWLGITYKEDKPNLVKEINKLILNNEYPTSLWKK